MCQTKIHDLEVIPWSELLDRILTGSMPETTHIDNDFYNYFLIGPAEDGKLHILSKGGRAAMMEQLHEHAN